MRPDDPTPPEEISVFVFQIPEAWASPVDTFDKLLFSIEWGIVTRRPEPDPEAEAFRAWCQSAQPGAVPHD